MVEKYFVYMVRCSDNTFYTGVTKNIDQRVCRHNGELSGGARYTRSRRPVALVYSETHESWKAAMNRELAIKRMTKSAKERLISSAASCSEKQ
jgi:putative endonuclease